MTSVLFLGLILCHLSSLVVAQGDGCFPLGDYVTADSIHGTYDLPPTTSPQVGPFGPVNTWATGEGPEAVLDDDLSTAYRNQAGVQSGLVFQLSQPLFVTSFQFTPNVQDTAHLLFRWYTSDDDMLDISALNAGDTLPMGAFTGSFAQFAHLSSTPVRNSC